MSKGTQEKLKIAKELLAGAFIGATTLSAESGTSIKYVSKAVVLAEAEGDLPAINGWSFDIVLKEPACPERTLQHWDFERPNNIDPKNMEYHVICAILSELTQTAVLTWNQLGKLLNTDLALQSVAIKTKKEK
jgi:hypothetical protein